MARAALCAVALRGKWLEGRSRSGVPQEARPVVPVTTSSPRLSFRARSSHCQVLALPQSHSPEGGTLRCQITPGEPTPRLPGVCGCSCVWSALRHTGAMWVAVEVVNGSVNWPSTDLICTHTQPSPCYPTISLLMMRRMMGVASSFYSGFSRTAQHT